MELGTNQTINNTKMKYLFLFLPIFSFAQVDSIVYEKVDTMWYKVTYSKDGLNSDISRKAVTTIDSLIKNILTNEVVDAGRQYTEFKNRVEKEETRYLLRLRQAEHQYRLLYNKRIDLDTIVNAKKIIGTWLYNGVEITINKTLKIGAANINFVSEDLFFIGTPREYFFRKEGGWYSDKSKLVKKVK